MCLAFVLQNRSEHYPLILLFNRDESHSRVTSTLNWWQQPKILAGMDLQSNGTWGGVSRNGKFALLTFIRGPREKKTPTGRRGLIVPKYLSEDTTLTDFVGYLTKSAKEFLGYNLIFGDRENVYHFDNFNCKLTKLADGVHGVSNAYLNTPWFKVNRGVRKLGSLIEGHGRFVSPNPTLESDVFEILEDQTRPELSEVQVTGLSVEKEYEKSAIFVALDGYGTKCSSLIMFDRDHNIIFTERTYNEKSECVEFKTFNFQIEV